MPTEWEVFAKYAPYHEYHRCGCVYCTDPTDAVRCYAGTDANIISTGPNTYEALSNRTSEHYCARYFVSEAE